MEEAPHVISIIEEPRPLSAAFLKEIGAVAFVMAQHGRHRDRPVHVLPSRIAHAAMARQIRIFYSAHSAPLGYITWAWLSPEAERRWIDEPDASLHPSEWTDGETLWIIDFVTVPGLERRLLNHVRDRLFADQSSVKALRRGSDDAVRKVSTWRRGDGAWRIEDTTWPSAQA